MDQVSLPYPVNGPEVHQHGDIHVDVQPVFPLQNFLTDLLPLPGVPVGDAGKLRFSVGGLQLPQRSQLPLLSAVAAGQSGSPSGHLSGGSAVGALVQDPVQAVGPEGSIDGKALLLLPAEMVKGKGPVQTVGQLPDGAFPDLLPGEQDPGLGPDGDLPADLQFIIKRISGKGAEGLDHHHRHIQLFQQHPHLPGQRRTGAVK